MRTVRARQASEVRIMAVGELELISVRVKQEEEGEGGPQGGREENEQEAKTSKRSVYLYYLGLIVVVIGFASCIMQLQFHGTRYRDLAHQISC